MVKDKKNRRQVCRIKESKAVVQLWRRSPEKWHPEEVRELMGVRNGVSCG